MSKRSPSSPTAPQRSPTPVPARAVGPRPTGPDQRILLTGIVVFVATFLAFLPALRNGFVDWDDPDNYLRNLHYRGLATDQLAWMFTASHMGHYQPLSWVTLACDYLWGRAVFGDGMDPRSYHLTNNVLHAANAVLAYLLILRLMGAAGRSAAAIREWDPHVAAGLAALLFALHPLRVESVAWLTERRDVLSSFFLLLTLLAYLRAQQRGANYGRWLASALVLYVLSLLSRAMGITLPLILLVLDWYPLERFKRSRPSPRTDGLGRALVEKIPFIVLAVLAGVRAIIAQRAIAATASFAEHGLAARLAQTCYGLVFYVHKTLVPLNLSPIYEMRLPIDVLAPRYAISAACVVAMFALLVVLAVTGRGRALVVATACYAILILPVSGIAQSGSQEAADRYSYLPALTLVALLAAGLLQLWQMPRAPLALRRGLGAAGGALLLVLATLTWRQCMVWRDTATLWKYAAAATPNSSIAQNGYGWVLLDQQHYDEALVHLRRAVDLQPLNEKAHNNIWDVLQKQKRMDELLDAYRQSIAVYPDFIDAHYHLRVEWQRRGESERALEEYLTVLRLQPAHSKAHTNLAAILLLRGETAAAQQHYELAIQADPQNVIARRGLAKLLKESGRLPEALRQLREALRSVPDDPQTQQLLAQWSAPAEAPPR